MLRAVGAAGAAIFGAAALSLVDMGAKRVAQSPPGTTALKVLTPQVAACSLLQGAALWSSSPLVALVLLGRCGTGESENGGAQTHGMQRHR